MAQKSEKVRVIGRVVKVEHKVGEFTGNDGNKVGYDFYETRLITDDYDLVHVRFNVPGPVDLPEIDDEIDLLCDARPAGGNVKITAEKSYTLVPA